MNDRDHWNRAYLNGVPEKLGWYRPKLETALGWIKELAVPTENRIIDVGGGASTLVGDLLRMGFQSLTVVDLSEQALALAQEHTGDKSDLVTWLNEDIRSVNLDKDSCGVWHDRATFHFLIDPDDQERYLTQLQSALKPGGYLIIGVFSPESPPKCSGLPVQRYSLDALVNRIGPEFELIKSKMESHTTPGGVEQMYLYCCFQRVGSA